MTRSSFLFVTILCCSLPALSQDSDENLASGLKRALIFGDQIEMSQGYVNTEAEHKKSAPAGRARDSFNKGDEFFSKGNFANAFMWYNVGFDIFLSLMNAKKPDSVITKSETINVFTNSQNILEQRRNARPMVEKAVENGNMSYFGPVEYWEYTRGLDASAMYYQAKGNFEKAEVLYLKALSIRGTQFGKTSEPYICTLANLATLRKDQGDFAASEDMFNYLLKAYAKAKGKTSVEYLITLNNQSMLAAKLGRPEAALATLNEVIKGTAGFTVLDAARIKTNHALLLAENEQPDKSIIELKEVMQTLEQNKHDDHPDYHTIATYLGRIYIREGMADKSFEVIDESIRKIKNTLGTEHPVYFSAMTVKVDYFIETKRYAEAQQQIATMLPAMEAKYGIRNKGYLDLAVKNAYCNWKTNDIRAARSQFESAMRQYLRIADDLFTSMSEAEQFMFWNMLKPQVDLFLAFAAENHAAFPQLIGQSYDLHIRTKGLLINNSRKVRERILKNRDPRLIALYKGWVQLKESLAGYLTMEKADLAAQGVDLADVETQINDLERELVQGSGIFKGKEIKTADWKAVQKELAAAEVAVEIIRIRPLLGEEKVVTYLGLVVAPGRAPALVVFSDGVQMETRDIAFYKNSIKFSIEDKTTYERFWKPLISQVPAGSTVYFSADGVFNSINLNAVKNTAGGYIIDDYQLISFSNTRFLGDYKNRMKAQTFAVRDALLIGSPEFGAGNIPPLPGAMAEIDKIEALLRASGATVERVTGAAATKAMFKSAKTPGVLHVATHGFFLNDSNAGSGIGRSYAGGIARSSENPLFKSGLLFAGASQAVRSGSVDIAGEGVVTAYEAMNLDLEQTQLVVLSACETGTGEIVNGEGVYGLIRSFQVAGAKATIMSLWKVDDQATQQLMVNFYQLLTASGDLPGSFRKAQQELRKQYPDPSFWGAFVVYL